MKQIEKGTWTQAKYFPIEDALEFAKVLPITENWTGQNILDFGCGAGRDAVVLAKQGANLYGVDILQSNLDHAEQLCKINEVKVEFKLVKEKDDIPYPDNFFDGIVCNGVVHHIKHAEEVVDEFYRVLKPNGMIYIMLYTEDLLKFHINTITNMIRNTPEKTWQRCLGEITDKCEYTTFYSVYEACNLFIPRGFQHVQSVGYHDYQFRIFKFKSTK